jgi:hypothetical protein
MRVASRVALQRLCGCLGGQSNWPLPFDTSRSSRPDESVLAIRSPSWLPADTRSVAEAIAWPQVLAVEEAIAQTARLNATLGQSACDDYRGLRS